MSSDIVPQDGDWMIDSIELIVKQLSEQTQDEGRQNNLRAVAIVASRRIRAHMGDTVAQQRVLGIALDTVHYATRGMK